MQNPELFLQEARRQQALDDLQLLDTPTDRNLDALTRVARDLFEVQTVLVSLVDRDRQWFKSRQGMDLTETPRSVSFCAHAVASNTPLIVEDTLQDPRFADHPLVLGPPYIRFYAGELIHAEDGQPLGTLCLIDPFPRIFDERQQQHLRDLTLLGEGCIHLHGHSSQARHLRDELDREQRRSLLDPLTQLWNRAGLQHFLPVQLDQARARGRQLGVLFCDLDHFKAVNDSYGHAAGDQVLWQSARRMQEALRPDDILTRYGGEEFMLLVQVHDEQELMRVAERVRLALAGKPVELENGPLRQTMSVGCTLIGADEPAEQALKRADQALYRAKGSGRDRCELARSGEAA
ncbi:GGDEF domain-containing protein [Pseudomonas mangrovi]|uniref:GGDEF domain-containing protein n=1 Tax=Pseudomonas mangrovi TaxID=2161748 RepID=A0A2T5PF87_9PSED|nr:sensor domain-containing diguanylate cyclase [Pseudomonas mangrovi]PTU76393.1 GGDEF domain-containing protein [Pseudomonas mangrovi]